MYLIIDTQKNIKQNIVKKETVLKYQLEISIFHSTTRQKISKEIENLVQSPNRHLQNNSLKNNRMHILSRALGTFFRIDLMSVHKKSQ